MAEPQRGLTGSLASARVTCLNSRGVSGMLGEQDVGSNRVWKPRVVERPFDRIPGRLGFDPCSAAAVACGRRQELSPQQQLAFDIFKELIEINTVTATGDTARAAEAMAARLRAAGFTEADVHAFFAPAPRKGNLVARLRGTGARKPILLVAHLDVVPANPRTGRSIRSS